MALIFDRKAFKSGVQVVKETIIHKGKGEGGKDLEETKTYSFKASDKGKEFTFVDEAKVLEKYPHLFKKK